jgi:hypothetical protein
MKSRKHRTLTTERQIFRKQTRNSLTQRLPAARDQIADPIEFGQPA